MGCIEPKNQIVAIIARASLFSFEYVRLYITPFRRNSSQPYVYSVCMYRFIAPHTNASHNSYAQ